MRFCGRPILILCGTELIQLAQYLFFTVVWPLGNVYFVTYGFGNYVHLCLVSRGGNCYFLMLTGYAGRFFFYCFVFIDVVSHDWFVCVYSDEHPRRRDGYPEESHPYDK